MKLADIADNGKQLETLRALRQRLATAIDESNSGRDISSLSRQLQIVLAQIAELEQYPERDEIAEILRESDRDSDYTQESDDVE